MNKLVLYAAVCLMAVSIMPAEAQDWARFEKYKDANEAVVTKPKAVLMGDSITEGWFSKRPEFFSENNFLGRGISGQCTSQMVVRFRRDVLDHSPKYVVILAGINDIAENNGFATGVENVFGNIVSMCEIAKANKIKPVLCTTTPATGIPWRKEVTNVQEKVLKLNEMIREYAKANHYPLVEYYNALVQPDGNFLPAHSGDGIHPTAEGYAEMEKILLKVLK